jgi:hypothetical protein
MEWEQFLVEKSTYFVNSFDGVGEEDQGNEHRKNFFSKACNVVNDKNAFECDHYESV